MTLAERTKKIDLKEAVALGFGVVFELFSHKRPLFRLSCSLALPSTFQRWFSLRYRKAFCMSSVSNKTANRQRSCATKPSLFIFCCCPCITLFIPAASNSEPPVPRRLISHNDLRQHLHHGAMRRRGTNFVATPLHSRNTCSIQP